MKFLAYETISTILLPGSMLFCATWALLDRFSPTSRVAQFLNVSVRGEWPFSFIALLVSLLLGSLLASALSYVEEYLLDRWAARRLKLPLDEYRAEWHRYMDALEDKKNPIVSRLVLYFFFETRAGSAGFVLSIALFFWVRSSAGYLVCGLGLVGGILLFVSGIAAHDALAQFRHRRYAQQKSSSNADANV